MTIAFIDTEILRGGFKSPPPVTGTPKKPSLNRVKVYACNIRSVLEYAAQVWQDIPAYLSDAIESIQRRALRIVFPALSYQQALNQANLPRLANRREFLLRS